MKKILVVGQTPPPYGGQSIMIENMLNYQFKSIKMYHVRMGFSKDMDEVGRFKFSKIFHLSKVVFDIYKFRFKYNINTLYYPPAGPHAIPIIRDVVILIATRWLFKHTIFHFHAGGVSEVYSRLGVLSRFFFKLAYFNADASISSSELNPPDGSKLLCKKNFIVPLGIEDHYEDFKDVRKSVDSTTKILFVGKICESKGVEVLIHSARLLKLMGLSFEINIMGKFDSQDYEEKIRNQISKYLLEQHITFLGVLTGDPKFHAFATANIFCFPTFFESETFGVVLLEAMQFSLPVIATNWRGIPSIITEGLSGYLVPIQDSISMADKLKYLIENEELAQKIGMNGRKIFLHNFTLRKYCENLEMAFLETVCM